MSTSYIIQSGDRPFVQEVMRIDSQGNVGIGRAYTMARGLGWQQIDTSDGFQDRIIGCWDICVARWIEAQFGIGHCGTDQCYVLNDRQYAELIMNWT